MSGMLRSGLRRKADIGKGEGRDDGVPVYRPHLLIRRSYRNFGPLAERLVSPWHDKLKKDRSRFHYCGTAVVDGHPCIKLRGDVTTGQRDQPGSSIVLFLATDRNHIPINSNVTVATPPTTRFRSA